MGHVANFVGRVFARFRRDDGVRDGEVGASEAHPDAVAQARADGFMEGMEFAEIVRKAQEGSDDYLAPDAVLAQVEHDLNEIEFPGYVRGPDDPVVH